MQAERRCYAPGLFSPRNFSSARLHGVREKCVPRRSVAANLAVEVEKAGHLAGAGAPKKHADSRQ